MVSNRATGPFQSVFKVDLQRQRSLESQQRVFVPRKTHRKSRGGCQGCKKRRLKCDESKPQCSKCAKLRVECNYPEALSPSNIGPSTTSSPQPVTSDMYSMAVDLVDTDLESLLHEGTPSQLSNARILHHFQSVTSLTLGCSSMQVIMHSFVGSNAWSQPSLMHLGLAVGLLLNVVFALLISTDVVCSPETSQQSSRPCLGRGHALGQGLQLHRQNLAALKPGDDNGSWDAVMAAFFLQIMLTFGIQDEAQLGGNRSSENVFSRTVDPLAATGGFKSLFYVFGGSFQPQSKWSQILESTDDIDGTFSSPQPGIDGLPRAFVDLFELDENSTADNNPYHFVVRILTPCLHLKPSTENYATLFACLGRVWSSLKTLLLRRDPRGLLLVSYWFALARQIDQWWLTKRARSECRAIVAYLSALDDPAISALLPFPAAFETADIAHMWRLLGYVLEDSVPLRS